MFTGVCPYLHKSMCTKIINLSINGMHQHWLSWFNAVLGQQSRHTVRKQEMVPNTKRVSPNSSHFAIHHRKTTKTEYNSTGTSFYQQSPALQSPQELQLHNANFLLQFPFSQEERESQQVRFIPFPKIILAALLQGHTLSAIHTAADLKAALRNSKKLEISIAAPAVPPEAALSPSKDNL